LDRPRDLGREHAGMGLAEDRAVADALAFDPADLDAALRDAPPERVASDACLPAFLCCAEERDAARRFRRDVFLPGLLDHDAHVPEEVRNGQARPRKVLEERQLQAPLRLLAEAPGPFLDPPELAVEVPAPELCQLLALALDPRGPAVVGAAVPVRRRVDQAEERRLAPALVQLARDLVRERAAEAVSEDHERSFGMDLDHLLDVVACHFLERQPHPLFALRGDTLDAVDGLIRGKVLYEKTGPEQLSAVRVHDEQGRLGPRGAKRQDRRPIAATRDLSVDRLCQLTDRRCLEED